jgi:hypothetical protein
MDFDKNIQKQKNNQTFIVQIDLVIDCFFFIKDKNKKQEISIEKINFYYID